MSSCSNLPNLCARTLTHVQSAAMGGKRKSKKRVITKERPKVATVFDCPFCNHSQTVEATMDHSSGTGTLMCRICAVKFQARISKLEDPIDLFSKWIDQSEELNKA